MNQKHLFTLRSDKYLLVMAQVQGLQINQRCYRNVEAAPQVTSTDRQSMLLARPVMVATASVEEVP